MTRQPSTPTSTRVATCLRDRGPETVTGLARTLGLSRTSVETAVATLGDLGLAAEAPAAAQGTGRPARRFAFDAASGIVAGIDVGVSSVRIVVSDLAGTVLAHRKLPGLEAGPAAAKLARIDDAIRACVADAGSDPRRLRALGLSVPGLVSPDGRLVVSSIVPEWSGAQLETQLRERFGCPVVVDNDIRLAAVAEHHLGAAQLVDDMVYLSVGHRISMGLILGGVPRRGVHNAAGEIGHVAFRALDDATGTLSWTSAPTAAEVFRLAGEGDDSALAEVTTFIDDLARGLASVAMTVDPAMVVIGGGISLAGERVLDPLREATRHAIRLPIDIPLVRGWLGADASAHGALVQAFARHATAVYGLDEMPVPSIATPTV